MKVQCLLQKFTSCCIARDMRKSDIKIFIGNAVQEVMQTNRNGEFPGHIQIKLCWIPNVSGCSLVVKCITVGRSFPQLFGVEAKYCVVNMGITCQDLTNHRISQNRVIGF